jgi:RNA polymerase sigma-70 factor (ECF subfamily)
MKSLTGAVVSQRPAKRFADDATLARLVALARSGDEQAQDALMHAYEGGVARYVVQQVGSGNHCEDLCQTIFVRMLLALPRLKSESGFESWLLTIARNVCIDHLRQRKSWRRIFTPFLPAHEAIADRPQEPEPQVLAETGLLDNMPADDRRLVLLSLDRGNTYEDLARLENTSVSAIKSRLFRARRRLRHSAGGSAGGSNDE